MADRRRKCEKCGIRSVTCMKNRFKEMVCASCLRTDEAFYEMMTYEDKPDAD